MSGSNFVPEVNARIPTLHGTFQLWLFRGHEDGSENLAATLGNVRGREKVLTRVHSECFTGDVLGSLRCDCGEQLMASIESIGRTGAGVLIYLRQEGRGIGLGDKLRAYNLQDGGLDTVEANLRLGRGADERDYRVAAEMLDWLGVRSISLLTNNPAKIGALRRLGVSVVRRQPIEVPPRPENLRYLRTKAERMAHMLQLGTRLQYAGQADEV